jgi:EAL domain-containing protein (putative c-di-GMP-specific phosphodiesterase class I)
VRVHAQPIVDATTGEIVSLEVLARVQHPERGTALPATFLADARPAERLALDSRVLADSLRALREHQQESGCSSPPYLNANLSLESLARPDLAEHVLGLLGRYDVDPSRLRLEVPELADLTTVQDAAPQLRALRSAGVAVTLDDLGAGSTSLRHLSALAIDGIKIDLSFVAGIVDNERDLAVVRMLIDLGAGLGLAVTAEGVETQDQLRLLRELGCPYVQGYLVGRPRPLSEALDAVAAGSPHVHLPG